MDSALSLGRGWPCSRGRRLQRDEALQHAHRMDHADIQADRVDGGSLAVFDQRVEDYRPLAALDEQSLGMQTARASSGGAARR